MDNQTYQTACLETLAGQQTYEQYVDLNDYIEAYRAFSNGAEAFEKIKKQIHYGKDIPSEPVSNPIPDQPNNILHAKLGIAGEALEVFDTLTDDEVKKEVGNLLWYVAVLLDEHDLTFDEVMEANIAKLRARYSTGKFTREEALNRADMGQNP